MANLIGRKKEQETLREALQSNEAEMVAIIGRRRVGKTFLIKKTYQEHILFEVTGTKDSDFKRQLENFKEQLLLFSGKDISEPIQIPKDWFAAFRQLKVYLIPLIKKEKKVIFFDEVPWLAANDTTFLSALGYFWNSWAAWQNVVLVLGIHDTYWMPQKLANNMGALYCCITKFIFLEEIEV